MGRLRIVAVRHGQSEWNAAGIYQGQRGPGLSPLGHEQAQRVAAHLRRRFPDAVAIERSDLPRVAETAAPTEAFIAAPVTVDARLREVDLGRWTGRTHAEIAAGDPDGLAAWRAWRDPPGHGGESFADFRARVRGWLADLLAKRTDGTVLVFTHGGVLRILAAAALDLPPDRERRLVASANASLSVVHAIDGDLRLVTYNETAHLTSSATVTP